MSENTNISDENLKTLSESIYNKDIEKFTLKIENSVLVTDCGLEGLFESLSKLRNIELIYIDLT